ncbi:MAG: acetyl-CoA decarbonylase/synthase complex subunit gamma [Actinobacteria bacterium]|nr:acetyl-CoA decarbonylase/synthase complex subunit gamma [Actinomycetota bacterium]MBU1944080.1 acetyl-CoA decarbonylase/synthase complex subunit gamma [Actinomycetota bacterium]MBU2687266.1 acetyl-CoA decarbonylase/synthase complex subunit gamma [Actinomycetota bacterium]
MALSGLDIFKLLPKTNCGECKLPTCLAFAMKLAGGQAKLEECPYVSDEAKEALSEAAAPPVRGVVVGQGAREFKTGEELVLFRHEKRFVNPTGMGVMITTDMSDDEIAAKVEEANKDSWERVGQQLELKLLAVKCTGDPGKFKDLLTRVAGMTELALMPMADNADCLKAAVEVVGDRNPLLYCATPENIDAVGAIAKEAGSPLVLKAEGLDALAELSEKATGMELKDLILDPGTRNLKDTMEALVAMRRAALNQKFKPFGFPIITLPCEETDDSYFEAASAGVYVAKYSDIVVCSEPAAWMQYPLQVEIQNIYTDPQKPMAVDSKFYEIGSPGKDSPVMVTTNFSLTYFIVSGEVEASKVDAWLGIVDSEGQSVLTAWAAGKFVPDVIAKFINTSGIADKVDHRKLIIPGYVAQISGELDEELPDWEIMVGPREAADISTYLRNYVQAG